VRFYEEANTDGTPKYCVVNNQWNPQLTGDVLKLVRGASFQSTIGWEPNAGPDAFKLSVADLGEARYQAMVWSATHELGHILGMMHEHQRPDRDLYLKVDYRNVLGMPEALQRFRTEVLQASQAQNIQYTAEQLATYTQQLDSQFLEIYRANPTSVQRFGVPAGIRNLLDSRSSFASMGPFDPKSIMMYEGNAYGADPNGCRNDLRKCTIALYNVPGNPSQGVRYLERNLGISAGDRAWVVAYYSAQRR
jgi:hypothetical protein